MRKSPKTLAFALLALGGCGGISSIDPGDGGAPADAGHDVGLDAGTDAGWDEYQIDAGSDAGVDAGEVDAGVDAGLECDPGCYVVKQGDGGLRCQCAV